MGCTSADCGSSVREAGGRGVREADRSGERGAREAGGRGVREAGGSGGRGGHEAGGCVTSGRGVREADRSGGRGVRDVRETDRSGGRGNAADDYGVAAEGYGADGGNAAVSFAKGFAKAPMRGGAL